MEENAAALDVGTATVKLDWQVARARLTTRIQQYHTWGDNYFDLSDVESVIS